ncbi:hypothetical protein GOBAR_DD16001 [Gossypium barbadense]|nr:hypothetical protein GOBAR_DD16001 [Gossypium barbadense]
MCGQGYDTWILELRGAGLSTQGMDFGQYIDPLDSISQRKDFYGYEGKDSGLAAVTTFASSLDYMSSRSSLKLLLPLTSVIEAKLLKHYPAQVLNVPVIPIGTLLAATHPFAANPPSCLETVPAKLLLQLATAFEEGGLRDRSGTFFYKNHLSKSNVPVLAIAGDQDLICPPDAVYVCNDINGAEIVKLILEPLVTYKVFGEPGGLHFAH